MSKFIINIIRRGILSPRPISNGMKIFSKTSAVILAVALIVSFVFGLSGQFTVIAATQVSLGNANSFAVLAGSGITIGGAVNTSAITGDIGTFPTVTITGIGNAVLTGVNHAGDATTQLAKTDLTAAFTLAGQATNTTTPTELGSTTKFPGVYDSLDGTFGLTGTLTLDARGDANAVFIFKAASTLITAGASSVSLINGAQACNVYWQVGSSATLGAASFLKGNILALTDINLGTTANVEGRVLARNGAVTLDGSDIITKATCVAPGSSSEQTPGITYTVTAPPIPPLISILKVPTPLALQAGPGQVIYDYTVANVGVVAMSNVAVVDNKCTPVTFMSGDLNGDSKLDTNENWKYSCTTTLPQTTTNTVTATGEANGLTTIDTANATVVVGVPKLPNTGTMVPPLIHLLKRPSVFLLPAPGGPVLYYYTVTNPGTVPLSNVSVIDDKCTDLPGRVTGHPGDLNKNDLLESNEVWSFTCASNLTETITNIGTAEGSANGLTAIDYAMATVVVSSPKLPNTGLPPRGTSTPWDVVLLASLLLVVSVSLVTVLKKHTS